LILTIAQNISFILAIVVVYHYVTRNLRGNPRLVTFINGALFGVAAILAMRTPFHFAEGIIYDGRTIVLGAAGLFAGPWVTCIAAGIAIGFRIFVIGGSGYLAGILSIIVAVIVGLIFHQQRIRYHKPLTVRKLYIIGLCIHICMLAAQFLLPQGRWREVMPALIIPIFTLYPLGFILVAFLFVDDENRLESQKRLEESEARYKLLFQNHHSVMLVIDPNSGAFVDANPAAEKYYGWTREELLKMHVWDINIASKESIYAAMQNAQSRRVQIFKLNHRLASGEIRNVEVYSGPIEYLGKTMLYSVINDTTDRLKAEAEVRDLHQTLEQRVARRTLELEDANTELESFAYSVSHDLRAPLRAIEGFSTLLTEESGPLLSENSLHYLDRINKNVRKMSLLIDDLLRLSRISRQVIETSPVNLSLIANEIVAELEAQSPDRKVTVSIQENMQAVCDRTLIRQVIYNLLSNAWKFTAAAGEPTIRFESTLTNKERIFSISDNGIGFDMTYADKLFAPFQRLHAEKEYSGSGIGLSIVRRIITRHGGRVWAYAEPDKGATFYFTLGG
jgi:PAS domain S-box-containing protein